MRYGSYDRFLSSLINKAEQIQGAHGYINIHSYKTNKERKNATFLKLGRIKTTKTTKMTKMIPRRAVGQRVKYI